MQDVSPRCPAPPALVDAELVAVTQPCREHFRVVLAMSPLPDSVPGQFVQVQAADVGAPTFHGEPDMLAPGCWAEDSPDALRSALLRRPFSIASIERLLGEVRVHLIGRVVGVGTAWLSRRRVGERISLIGPLGQGFWRWDQRSPAIREHWLVGGGVGLPPMMRIAEAWAGSWREHGQRATAFVAAMSADLLAVPVVQPPDQHARATRCVEPFAELGVDAIVTTDDGSLGVPGRVTVALDAALAAAARAGQTDQIGIYVCGSTSMMRAVSTVAGRYGVATQVCLEQAMACGLGTCQSCVVKIADGVANSVQGGSAQPGPLQPGWTYKLCCTDGPVWDSRDVVW